MAGEKKNKKGILSKAELKEIIRKFNKTNDQTQPILLRNRQESSNKKKD